MFCYVGKATKIFIFIVAVVVITGLIVGFGVLRKNIHPKSRKCSGEECSVSDYSPPPPLQVPFTSLPNPNPSDPTIGYIAPPPPPPTETSLPPPQPPPETSLPPPQPPPETSLPPPSPPPETSMPPPPPSSTSIINPSPPPPTAAPPQAVEVSPGPTNSA